MFTKSKIWKCHLSKCKWNLRFVALATSHLNKKKYKNLKVWSRWTVGDYTERKTSLSLPYWSPHFADLASLPKSTNGIFIIPNLSYHASVFKTDVSAQEKQSTVCRRREETAIVLMQDILRTYSKTSALVSDQYFETGATAKVCISEDKNRRSIVCNKDSKLVREKMPFVIFVHTSQVLNRDSDINEKVSVGLDTRTFLCMQEAASREESAWMVETVSRVAVDSSF